MEIQGCSEVRRVHIVYFLSRNGRIEHPHLVRVHHHSRNGVRLRDVKRWLGELRGNDMPKSFSWSYKRRYKTGFVWQDLLDDDLINPISDNEYVLKGSDIKVSKEDQSQSCHNSSEIEEENPNFSSEASTLTEDLIKKPEHAEKKAKKEKYSSTFLSKMRSEKSTTAAVETNSDHSKITSNKPTTVFRNMIKCGGSDTNDSAVVPMFKQSIFFTMCSSESKSVVQKSGEICKREHDRFGGSKRVFGIPRWTQQQYLPCGRKSFDGVKDSLKSKSQLTDEKANSAVYVPVNAVNCSKCGKRFKPEKIYAHMKTCKGTKVCSL